MMNQFYVFTNLSGESTLVLLNSRQRIVRALARVEVNSVDSRHNLHKVIA